MADHRHRNGGVSPKKLAISFLAAVCACLLIWGGLAMERSYSKNSTASGLVIPPPSATEEDAYVSGGAGGADPETSYVKVIINGQSRFVFGMHFTDVKSVLRQGGITLQQGDTVSPALSSPVNENTVITIESPNSKLSTQESPIAYNVITKDDPDLEVGHEKVAVKGKNGVMQTTRLVQYTGSKATFSTVIVSFVKTAPTNELILIGTKAVEPSGSSASQTSSSNSSQPSSSVGTTKAVGSPQKIAEKLLSEHGWDGEQFTCLVELWQKESGWSVTAENPSGAYGIPQALPGSKMGPGWRTNATVQISWGLEYIATRYGTPCEAWAHEVSYNWY